MQQLFLFMLWFLSNGLKSNPIKPSVHWYTNYYLSDNQRIYNAEPAAFSGFNFCCQWFHFTANGDFIFNNNSDLIDNVNYFRPKLSKIYIVGGVSIDALNNNTITQSSYDKAIQIGESLGIDGWMLDFEPQSNNKTLAIEFAKFLGDFQSAASSSHSKLEIGVDISNWGILATEYYPIYASAKLDKYLNMATYDGADIESDEQYVNDTMDNFPAETIRMGIGAMLTTEPPDPAGYFNWTSQRLTEFLDFLKVQQIPSVDIWRPDI
eukprot:212461_1